MEDSTCLLPGVPGAVPGGVPGGVYYPGNVHKTCTHPGKADPELFVRDARGENVEGEALARLPKGTHEPLLLKKKQST